MLQGRHLSFIDRRRTFPSREPCSVRDRGTILRAHRSHWIGCCGTNTCSIRSQDGLQQSGHALERGGGAALRHAAGRAGAAAARRPHTGLAVVERRWRRAGMEPQAPAVRAPGGPGGSGRHQAADAARARCHAVRRAALPLQLLVPRRGLATPSSWPRKRPRLGLEALALTDHDGFYGVVRFAEAAQGGRPADGVRRRGHAHPRLGGWRARRPDADGGRHPAPGARWRHPASSTNRDPHGEHLLVLADGPAGYAALSHARSASGTWRGRRARRSSASPTSPPPVSGTVVGAHRVPQGVGARGAAARRPARRRDVSCSG